MDEYKPGYLGKYGPHFKVVLKSPSVNILRSRCETVISGHRQAPLPLLQTYSPTLTYTHQLDWQGRLEACYFCSSCHPKDKLIFSFSNTWQGTRRLSWPPTTLYCLSDFPECTSTIRLEVSWLIKKGCSCYKVECKRPCCKHELAGL